MMSVPRPAMLVAMVIDPGTPAWTAQCSFVPVQCQESTLIALHDKGLRDTSSLRLTHMPGGSFSSANFMSNKDSTV